MTDKSAVCMESEEIQEYSPDGDYFNKVRTITLIDLFKKYKPMVAAGSIKTMKQMWEIISVDLTNLYEIPISIAKCENRFKVLERGYKKMKGDIENGKKPRRVFQYFEEFKDLHTKKYTILPGLNSSNYAEYTSTNFGNTLTPLTDVDFSAKSESMVQVEDAQQEVKTTNGEIYFTRERTLTLIHLFREYNQKVTEGKVKTKKKMWALIAKDLSNIYNIPISGTKCENKLKVLERNYKKGSERKRSEFQEELNEIFQKTSDSKRNAVPVQATHNSTSTSTVPQQVTIRVLDPKPLPTDKIEIVLSDMRNDFQNYYKERLDIEKQKLALAKEKMLLKRENLLLEREKLFFEREKTNRGDEQDKTKNI